MGNQSLRLRGSDAISVRVGEICAHASGEHGYCPYHECWGCPPWFVEGHPQSPSEQVDGVEVPSGMIVCSSRRVSERTYEIVFKIGDKTFVEQREAIDWPWLCCPFRFKERSF